LAGLGCRALSPGREQKLVFCLENVLRKHPLPAEEEKNTTQLPFFFGSVALLDHVLQLLSQLSDVVLRVRRDSMRCPAHSAMLFRNTSHSSFGLVKPERNSGISHSPSGAVTPHGHLRKGSRTFSTQMRLALRPQFRIESARHTRWQI
jgi:hypothetical protein